MICSQLGEVAGPSPTVYDNIKLFEIIQTARAPTIIACTETIHHVQFFLCASVLPTIQSL